MGNEQEYIELVGQNRELIDSACAPLLNSKRQDAFERFKAAGFPTRKDETWLNTPIAKLFGIDYGMNLKRAEAGVNAGTIFHCDVPNLKSHRVYIVNDSYSPAAGHSRELPEGVILGSLNAIANNHPTLLEKYYNRLADKTNELPLFTRDWNKFNEVKEHVLQLIS